MATPSTEEIENPNLRLTFLVILLVGVPPVATAAAVVYLVLSRLIQST